MCQIASPQDVRFHRTSTQPAPIKHIIREIRAHPAGDKEADFAAAQDLRQLHEQFGDWRLAVAAYNSGAGTVTKLLKRYQTKSYERIAPHLPAETQMYVPKVEATSLHREGLELEKLKT